MPTASASTRQPTTTSWWTAPWKWALLARQLQAGGVPHEFVVAGAAPSFDGERLLADTQKICEAEIAFWHADGSQPPMDRYVFMLNVVDDNYGGLEHRNSTALICGRRDLPRKGEAKAGEGYTTLLGLISHEYFHTWNVKRLRPAELARYDYEQENYTELLWFFEGFTSYYDDLFLRRAGLLDNASTSSSSRAPSTRCCRRRAAWCSPWPRPASTPGSSTTARTRTPPITRSATTPRARWSLCAWTWPCAPTARAAWTM
jgi:predicted metalloprotease with PDZ domain